MKTPLPDPVSKNQVALAKIYAATQRATLRWGFFRHAISLAAAVLCIYLLIEGFKPAISRDADTIRAIASLVKAFRLDTIIASLTAAFFGVSWRIEKGRVKRALTEKAKFQKELEGRDPSRSSSNNPI